MTSKTTTDIDVLLLKQLLINLKQYRPEICIRFRMIGELWQPLFLKIMDVTDSGVALLNEAENRLTFIQNLCNVMQFEIDCKFQNYQPNNHYDVTLSN